MKCNYCHHKPKYPAKFYELDDWLSLIFIILGVGGIGFMWGRLF